MQSRKSSILKPRKAREPLQDLNQLLPNNDDEETTTTDAQKRRVSFASMNKVKEYETASDCVAIINAPPANDKRFSFVADSCQFAVVGKNFNDENQFSSVSRKSIHNSLKINTTKQVIVDENLYVEEDVELTETIGRIYDIPMKSSGDSSMELTHVTSQNISRKSTGDSSMEMTHVITQTEIRYEEESKEISEVIGPLNLTKENFNQTSNFADAHILEIEYLDKNEKDGDTSSMETTEVISNNIISVEKTDGIEFHTLQKEPISVSFTRSENEDTSSMETTEVNGENFFSECLKSRSDFYETLQSSQGVDTTINQPEEIEYISVKNLVSSNNILVSSQEENKTKYFNSTMQFLSQDEKVPDSTRKNTDVAHSSSVSPHLRGMVSIIDDNDAPVASQEVNETKYLNSTMQFLTQDEVPIATEKDSNHQNCGIQLPTNTTISASVSSNLSNVGSLVDVNNVPVASQEENKTKYSNSTMQLLTQDDEVPVATEKDSNQQNCGIQLPTNITISASVSSNLSSVGSLVDVNNVPVASQEENKTKYSNSTMQLLTQDDEVPVAIKKNSNQQNCGIQLPPTEIALSASASSNLSKIGPSIDFNDVPVTFQEENKTKYLNSTMQFSTQDNDNHLRTTEYLNRQNRDASLSTDDVHSASASSTSSRVIPPVNVINLNESSRNQAAPNLDVNVENEASVSLNQVDANEVGELNDIPQEITSKSSIDEESSANDSNSPLTVGVNFSIFQKNNETRVEFSGTIDSNKKKKSISNVMVNIIDNKNEKKHKHVKELRFSMPAKGRESHECDNKRTDFSATFTNFSIPNEESIASSHEKIASDIFAKKFPSEFTETGLPTTFESFDNVDDGKISAQVAKPAKKRASDDAFNDKEESQVHAKRRSLSNEADNSNSVSSESMLSKETECNSASAHLMKHNFTEIKQCTESFVREEKSVFALNDVVVETCSRTANMNISYEARQLTAVSSQEGSSFEEVESTNVQKNNLRDQSCTILSADTNVIIKERSQEIRSESDSDQSSINDGNSKNQSVNQSTPEDEIIDYSLHNPSIIVNIGDSFLGADNISFNDVRKSVEAANEIKRVIDTDDISKENFVVEWLQNKTGKMAVENRFYTSSTDSSALSTTKSIARINEKSSSNNISESFPLMQENELQFKDSENQKSSIEITTEVDSNQNEEKQSEIMTEEEAALMEIFDEKIANDVLDDSCDVNANQRSEPEEIMEIDSTQKAEKANPVSHTNLVTEASVPSCVATADGKTGHEDIEIETDWSVSQQDAADTNDHSDIKIRKEEGPELVSPENDCKVQKVDEQVSKSMTNLETDELIRDPEIRMSSKLMSRTKLSLEPVFLSTESTSEKRQKMSPEFERNKMEIERSVRPKNVPDIKDKDPKENVRTEKSNRRLQNTKYESIKKDILQKIESLSKGGKEKWKLKTVSDNKWVFQFFFDQLELIIEFPDEKTNACRASCQFIQPPQVKYYEISKIAVDYLVRKNESKLKKICCSVEDVPYLLKLIEPDIDYIEGFVADFLKLCESEIFSIKNGRALFFVYSFKKLRSVKVQVNISRLEKLSVSDLLVEELVGKTDINLVRKIFSEAGRDYDFFSKFVKNLWSELDQ